MDAQRQRYVTTFGSRAVVPTLCRQEVTPMGSVRQILLSVTSKGSDSRVKKQIKQLIEDRLQ